MRFLTLAAALFVAPTVVAAQVQPPGWNLQVGLFGYRPDGTVSTTAFETNISRKSLVFVTESGCGLGAGVSPWMQKPIYAWSFTGKVLDITAEMAIIQLDWQRVIDERQPATTPGGSVQLTLQAGERVLLDSVVPQVTAHCWSSVGFEARYRANPFTDVQMTVSPDGAVRAGGAAFTRPAGGGRGSVSPDGGSASGGSAGSGGSVRSAGAAAPDGVGSTSTYDVHLWLVRSAPGHPEQSHYRQFSVAGSNVPFAFAPLSIDTPQGAIGVTVGGSLGVRTGEDGEYLLFLMNRNVTPLAGGASAPRYSAAHIKVLPVADDVLSLEMPPIRLGEQDLPDRLSVRLRVVPR